MEGRILDSTGWGNFRSCGMRAASFGLPDQPALANRSKPPSKCEIKAQFVAIVRVGRSNRSEFITLVQAKTKSFTNFSFASALA
jgi:hypothetical protein